MGALNMKLWIFAVVFNFVCAVYCVWATFFEIHNGHPELAVLCGTCAIANAIFLGGMLAMKP
jgi:hypothetical protein